MAEDIPQSRVLNRARLQEKHPVRKIIDIGFDFKAEAGGRDSDRYSPTLQEYHRIAGLAARNAAHFGPTFCHAIPFPEKIMEALIYSLEGALFWRGPGLTPRLISVSL